MVAISDQLVWELVKRNNCFLKKVNGRSKRSGSIHFSLEKGNLRSRSSYKHSGLAQSKTIDVTCTATNTAILSTKTASKSATKVAGSEIPMNKGFNLVVKSITSHTSGNYYRPDLKNDALAKFSKVYQANRIAKGVKGKVPVKTGRRLSRN
mmetsp:Transcript_23522/g.27775  ORF Transcript_23522/g.27775 Transcript_23522/m.27775 type:complete len:151 (+) Transcript_23522:109-561(+)|eukprot:CAMPEP_0198256740 /NCGR_PEP_ID=MMETSP1447-20131203/6563_1 /TAXON_ID=420782 /ORGANISM="Chaetoceros dichaeta, Strain CCMP1751" /LENGTH=150 /DNA_ID=CAMNT_0043943445 /DNA_START=96 /DNA_END=548 /DNA_ORIENTATION=-